MEFLLKSGVEVWRGVLVLGATYQLPTPSSAGIRMFIWHTDTLAN
jgi:hypothetical protein